MYYVNQNRINRVIERLYGAKALHLFYAHIIRIYAKTIPFFFYWVASLIAPTYTYTLTANVVKP